MDELRNLIGVQLVHKKKEADTLEIEFRNPGITYPDLGIFDYGSRIYVLAGWNDEVETKGPFRVVDINYMFPEAAEPTFKLICKDPTATIMAAQSKSKKINKLLDELVREVALEHGMVPDMDITAEEQILLDTVQRGESDTALLQRLAVKHGFVWFVRGNTLYWQRPDKAKAATYRLCYRMGDFSCKRFVPELKAKGPGGKKKQPAKQNAVCEDWLSAEERENLELVTAARGGDATARKRLLDVVGATRERVEGGVPWGSMPKLPTTLAAAEEQVQSLIDGAPSLSGLLEQTDAGEFLTSATRTIQQVKERGPLSGQAAAPGGTRWGLVEVEGVLRLRSNGPLESRMEEEGPLFSSTPDFSDPDNPLTETSEQVRGTDVSAPPQNAKEAKARLNQATKLVPIEAEITPTIPSWRWKAIETIDMQGVSARLSGLYDVVEARLGYTTSDGLTCVLKGVKRHASAAATPTASKSPAPSANEAEQPQATQVASDTPGRPAVAVDREVPADRFFLVHPETGGFERRAQTGVGGFSYYDQFSTTPPPPKLYSE